MHTSKTTNLNLNEKGLIKRRKEHWIGIKSEHTEEGNANA